MPLDTPRPAHCLTFEQACEIVSPRVDPAIAAAAALEQLIRERDARLAAAPPVVFNAQALFEASQADLAEQADRRDRYGEPGPRGLPDDGFSVERWGRAGR